MMVLLAIAVVIVASAATAMALRNIIHSVLLLTLNWMGIAAFYLWAGAEFVAFAQVLVYVGAVSMVVLFAVLLTRREAADAAGVSRAALSRACAAIVTAAVVCGVLVAAVRSTDFGPPPEATPELKVRQLGGELMGSQTAALLVAGLILTVALLGGVVIASKDAARGKESDS